MKVNFYNYIFTALLSLLGIVALTNFHIYMDEYEVGILIAAVVGFSYLGMKWNRFKHFFLASFALAFLSIYLYQGDISQANSNFILKYFLSSQSSIMWMSALFPLGLIIYWFYMFVKQEFYGNFASFLIWAAATFATSGLLVSLFELYLISIDT